MDDVNKIIMNRINDGKYTENDILNLAVKIYALIKENPSARRLVVRLYRGDAAAKYCTDLHEFVSDENPVEIIKFIIEKLVKKLDGLDDIYLYQPIKILSNFDINFLELQVLIEWSCYNGKEEEDGRTTDI